MVPAMVSNKPRIEIETNSKSILDSCLSQYRNQHQYFTQASVNIKTKVRNRKFEFNTKTAIETNQFRLSLVWRQQQRWYITFQIVGILSQIIGLHCATVTTRKSKNLFSLKILKKNKRGWLRWMMVVHLDASLCFHPIAVLGEHNVLLVCSAWGERVPIRST